jgi:N6-adenosine-specific RNA methylase IME4
MRYPVVLADPPWSFYGAQDKWAAAAKFYPLMSDDDLAKFPMQDWMAVPGVLFLWVPSAKLDVAIDCIRAWDLHFRGVAFVWVKTTQAGVPIAAQGVRPSITKPLTEFVLAASTHPKGRPLPIVDEAVRQTVFAPKQAHSTKPEQVQANIEALYPSLAKVELFARRRRDGWDAWGDEV